jgi:hypothetical protein
MPSGTCDPATRGDPYNVQTLSMGNGQVTIDIRYGWDGVSVRPDCDGPLVNGTGTGNVWAIRVTNNDSISWWVHTIGKRGQPHNIQFTPGSVTTFTKTQASNNGYDSISDFSDLTLTTLPTNKG